MTSLRLNLFRHLATSQSTEARRVVLVSLLVFSVVFPGCSNAEPPNQVRSKEKKTAQANEGASENSLLTQTATTTLRSASAEIEFGPDFRYDPDDQIEGNEEFVTIRLGNGLRIYYRGEWRPATLALLDDQNNVLVTIRLDLPPVGAISGTLPNTSPACAKVRLIFAADSLATRSWDKQIGQPATELTTEMVNDLNTVARNGGSNSANSVVVLASHEATLDPTFGSIHIVACDAKKLEAGVASMSTYTGNFVADHLRSEEGKVSDEAWLPRRVLNVFDELRRSSGPSKPAAAK